MAPSRLRSDRSVRTVGKTFLLFFFVAIDAVFVFIVEVFAAGGVGHGDGLFRRRAGRGINVVFWIGVVFD